MENIIGQVIKLKRKQSNLTQRILAEKAGVGIRLIRDIEQNKPRAVRIDTLNRILKLFGKQVGVIDIERT